MDISKPEISSYLTELHSATQGDTGAQVSMYEIGEKLGMDKGEAGAMAENLIVEGLVELVSLTGSISLTQKGLETLEATGSVQGGSGVALQLGAGPVMDRTNCEVVETVLLEIKLLLEKKQVPYSQLEEVVADIKTVETQLLSPQPKVAVVREVLRSLLTNFTALKIEEPQIKLQALVSS